MKLAKLDPVPADYQMRLAQMIGSGADQDIDLPFLPSILRALIQLPHHHRSGDGWHGREQRPKPYQRGRVSALNVNQNVGVKQAQWRRRLWHRHERVCLCACSRSWRA